MSTTKGIDLRPSGGGVLVRVGIDDSTGTALGTGTATLRVMEYQSDGTAKQLDFADNGLKTAGLSSPTVTMAPRPAPDGLTTGLFVYALSAGNCANFTVGATYVVVVTHSALPGVVLRREWQYGGAEGDLSVNSSGQVTLSPNGLDSIVVESGVNMRQAQSPMLAAAAGKLSGAGTGTIVVTGGNVSTTRITATTDSSGNRTSVTLALPA